MADTVHLGVTGVAIAVTAVLLISAWRLFLKGVRRSVRHRMGANGASGQTACLQGGGETDSSTSARVRRRIECSLGFAKAQRMTRWEENIRQIKLGPTFIQRTQSTFQSKLRLESSAESEDSIANSMCWSFGSDSTTRSEARGWTQGDKEDFAKPKAGQ